MGIIVVRFDSYGGLSYSNRVPLTNRPYLIISRQQKYENFDDTWITNGQPLQYAINRWVNRYNNPRSLQYPMSESQLMRGRILAQIHVQDS